MLSTRSAYPPSVLRCLFKQYLSTLYLGSLPETMTINGQDCCNTQVIAEHFNTFFATIGAQNEAHIRTHQGSHFRDYLTRHTEARFVFHEIHNYETIRIIKNIKLSSSNGHDGISSELLKLLSDDISKCITLIINQSLMSGIFPDKLNIAKVTPIYKKNDKKKVTNYSQYQCYLWSQK